MRTVIFAVVALLLVTAPARGSGSITPFHDGGGTIRAEAIRLTAFGGIAIPSGEFGRENSALSGFALSGPVGGLELSGCFRHDVEVGGGVWLVQNPGDGDGLASYWGLMRIGYSPSVRKGTRVFGAGYLGTVYAHSPNTVLDLASGGFSGSTTGHSYFGPAAGAGAGVRVGEHVTFEMLYLRGAGDPQGSSGSSNRGSQPFGEFQAAVGYGFGL